MELKYNINMETDATPSHETSPVVPGAPRKDNASAEPVTVSVETYKIFRLPATFRGPKIR